jgi:hypothetical protein
MLGGRCKVWTRRTEGAVGGRGTVSSNQPTNYDSSLHLDDDRLTVCDGDSHVDSSECMPGGCCDNKVVLLLL